MKMFYELDIQTYNNDFFSSNFCNLVLIQNILIAAEAWNIEITLKTVILNT